MNPLSLCFSVRHGSLSQEGVAGLGHRPLLGRILPRAARIIPIKHLPVPRRHGIHSLPGKQQHLRPIVPFPRFVRVIHLAWDIHQRSWPGYPFPEPPRRCGGKFFRHWIFSPRSRVPPRIVVFLAHVGAAVVCSLLVCLIESSVLIHTTEKTTKKWSDVYV